MRSDAKAILLGVYVHSAAYVGDRGLEKHTDGGGGYLGFDQKIHDHR